jgi:hypothetical protein
MAHCSANFKTMRALPMIALLTGVFFSLSLAGLLFVGSRELHAIVARYFKIHRSLLRPAANTKRVFDRFPRTAPITFRRNLE